MVSPAFLCDSKVKSEKSFRLQSMQSYTIKVEAPRPIRGTGQERMLPMGRRHMRAGLRRRYSEKICLIWKNCGAALPNE